MEEVENLVRAAMQRPRPPPSLPVGPQLRFDTDDFIDDTIAADARQHRRRPATLGPAEEW